jgi:hypothetical protein
MIQVFDKITGKRVSVMKHHLGKRYKVDKDQSVPSGKDRIETDYLNETDLSIPSNRITKVSNSDLGATGPSITSVRGSGKQTGGPYMKTAVIKPMAKLMGGKKQLETDDILKEIEKSFQTLTVKNHNKKITGGMLAKM